MAESEKTEHRVNNVESNPADGTITRDKQIRRKNYGDRIQTSFGRHMCA